MNRLLEIGFEPAGTWAAEAGRLQFRLTRHAAEANILYAFVRDGQVMYVGKTARTLAERMNGYRSPAATQITNIVNGRRIREALEAGAAIDILALPDNGLLHYGQFHLNLAAGLEDDIIRRLAPPWNGSKAAEPAAKDAAPATVVAAAPAATPRPAARPEPIAPVRPAATARFEFVLQPTYYNQGFFNVGVKSQALLGADGQKIELFLGDDLVARLGTINRRVNPNRTPRVMGGPALRGWFFQQASEMDRVEVDVLSPTSLRLNVVRH